MADGVRLDKWLMVARVFKTRSLAKRACDLGRVTVNGLDAKAHKQLALGDRVEVELGDWRRVLVVKELRDRPLKKAEAPRLYDDQSPPRPRLDALERLMRRAQVTRERGRGRPSKKERRELERWRRRGAPPE
ncbi:MAG: RNA-binding S4 domain-containing protein [Acidobacteria bacterium]|nr:MAG: RNA-binding S4 domain-containing protein [Acidobacteriota bacterium]